MKFPAKFAVLLFPLLLTACFHKKHQAQVQPLAPPLTDNQPPPPAKAPDNLPSPVATIPTEPVKNAPTPPQPLSKPAPKHKKPVNKTTQEVASNPAPTVSAVGELSSGDPADFRRETEDSIASIQHGLENIHRNLSDTEQKTADQIKEFLKQARAALSSGDVDGAHTLAAKAKVLLNEITD
jgi:outer membrane biosynthesis protein TonB